jgi:C4-dicarboxylate transporter DctM subunit
MKDASLALLMPVIILGSIILGIATPTEAAGVAVVYGFLVSMFIYRSLSWKELWKVTYETLITTCSVMIIIGFSALVGWILSYERVPVRVAEFIISISPNKWTLLFIIDVFLIIIGTFLHGTPIILVAIPILLPLVKEVGIDLLHFGMIVIFGIGVGQQTPPLGTCLFVTSALAGLDIIEVAKAGIPFIILLIGLLFLISYVPSISLFLPNLVGL